MMDTIVTALTASVVTFVLSRFSDFVGVWRQKQEEKSIKNNPRYYLRLHYQPVIGKDREDFSWLLFLHPYGQEKSRSNVATVAHGDGVDAAEKAVEEFCGYVHFAGEDCS